MSTPLSLGALDDAALDALRADLDGWTVEATEELLGPVAMAALDREQRVPALRVLRSRTSSGGAAAADRHATLTRLFVLGDQVTRRQARAALAHLTLERALAAGLIELTEPTAGAATNDSAAIADAATNDSAAAARVDLRPFEGAWILSDLGEEVTGRPLPPDHVLGVGGASLSLARTTVRRDVASVLDLGTGSGIQAVLAARHARRVVATDLSRRALAMARVTLRLAGVGTTGGAQAPATELDLREGSLLEPVAGESFDLVVSNPPFVITPATIREDPALGLLEYRDGGRAGDAIVADLVRGVGEVLAPGGIAQFLGNWEHDANGWRHRLEEWLDAPAARSLDAWVVQREVIDPANYVEMWLRDGGTAPGSPVFEAAYDHWLADFEARGVSAIGFGSITLRKPVDRAVDPAPAPTAAAGDGGDANPAPWRRLEEVSSGSPDGEHIAAVLDVVEALRGLDDAALGELRLRVAPDVTEERHHRPGEPEPTVIQLRQGGAYARTRRVDTLEAGFVGVCDGELSIRQIAGALAALLDLDADEAVAHLAGVARELLIEGFLTLA